MTNKVINPLILSMSKDEFLPLWFDKLTMNGS